VKRSEPLQSPSPGVRDTPNTSSRTPGSVPEVPTGTVALLEIFAARPWLDGRFHPAVHHHPRVLVRCLTRALGSSGLVAGCSSAGRENIFRSISPVKPDR